jgi:hypothetical protein
MIKNISVRFDQKMEQASYIIKVFEEEEGIDFSYVIDIFFDPLEVLESLISLKSKHYFISKRSYKILKEMVLGRSYTYERMQFFNIDHNKPYDVQIMKKFDTLFNKKRQEEIKEQEKNSPSGLFL